MEQGNLDDNYSFDVSWDHASNQDAITTLIDTYICPSNPNQRFLLIENIGGGKKAATCDYAAVAGYVYTEGYAIDVVTRAGGETNGYKND